MVVISQLVWSWLHEKPAINSPRWPFQCRCHWCLGAHPENLPASPLECSHDWRLLGRIFSNGKSDFPAMWSFPERVLQFVVWNPVILYQYPPPGLKSNLCCFFMDPFKSSPTMVMGFTKGNPSAQSQQIERFKQVNKSHQQWLNEPQSPTFKYF